MGTLTASRLRPATRTILRAVAMLGSAQGLSMLCSLVRNKLVALWAGPGGVALLGIFSAAVEMFSAVAQQGVRTSSVADIAAVADNKPRLARVTAVVARYGLIIGIAGGALMALLAPLLSRISFGTGHYTWAFVLLGAAVLLNAFTATRQAIAQGTGHLARLARASLIGSVAGLAATVPLIYFLRLEGMAWIIVVYSAATAAALSFPRLRLPSVALRDTLREGAGFMRLGLWLTLTGVIGWGVSYLLMSWLHYRGGDSATGLYQSGYTVAVRYVGIIFTSISLEFYPRLAQRAARAGRSPRHAALLIAHENSVVLTMAVPAAAILIILAPWVMRLLYSAEFVAAVPFVAGCLAAIPFRSLSWCAGFLIIARGDGRVFLATELASNILCLLLSGAGYILGGMAGLGAAYLLWLILYTVIVLAVCRHRYGVAISRRPIALTAAASLFLLLLWLASATLLW